MFSPVTVSGMDCKFIVFDLLCSNRRAPTILKHQVRQHWCAETLKPASKVGYLVLVRIQSALIWWVGSNREPIWWGCRLKINFDRVDSPDYRLKRKMNPSPALLIISPMWNEGQSFSRLHWQWFSFSDTILKHICLTRPPQFGGKQVIRKR